MQANAAVLEDGLVSGQHARVVRASGGYDLEDLGSKNGTFVDNVRVEGRVRLRDGALVFIGNHVGVFRMVSALELDAMKAELVAAAGAGRDGVAGAGRVACDRLRRLAASEGELFIVGETGVGKEVYARAVHQASGRKRAFVAINCAAIPRELVESELFGYRAGAHSTAHQAKAGLIEEAEGGTLFLDEIGEMTPEAQIKILRFLQDRELTPLGATRPRRMDVRIIAATNRAIAARRQVVGAARRHRRPPGGSAHPPAAAARPHRGSGRADRAFPRRARAAARRASSSRRSGRCRCTAGRSTCASWRRSSPPPPC